MSPREECHTTANRLGGTHNHDTIFHGFQGFMVLFMRTRESARLQVDWRPQGVNSRGQQKAAGLLGNEQGLQLVFRGSWDLNRKII